MNWFKSKKEKIDEAVKKALATARPTRVDSDFARTQEIIKMVNSLQQNRPQTDMNNFFGQMMEFEKMKQGVVEVENNKLDMLRQQIEQEGADSDGDFKMEDILGMIQGVQGENKPTNSNLNAPTMSFPNPHQETREVPKGNLPPPDVRYSEPPMDFKPLAELNPIEASIVDKAIKKIPKTAKVAFKALSPEKQEAVIQRMADSMEN